MTKLLAKIGEGGRLVIPAEYRKALGVATGDEVMLILDGESIHISTPKQGIRRAQVLVRAYIPEGLKLSEELIAERRAEASREQ
jgi:AbrB family looped-hinge helix DNA binding protein